MGFRHIGRNVRISDRAALYDVDRISIGDNSRIDDFCVLAGSVTIGRNVHVTVFCNLAGGRAGVTLADFSTLVGRYAILGTGTIVLPGVTIGEGVSAGAGSVFTTSADPWGIYVGAPARRAKERSRDLLQLAEDYRARFDGGA